MLQGYGNTVLRAEILEKELNKARKHSAMLQSNLDGAFAQYHNEVQDMQAKSDELVRKNKSLFQKNNGMPVDEDITSTSTAAAPSLQAPPSGPITRARARELNYVMVLKNEGYVAGFGQRTNVNL
jgi:hypothetical protein